MIKTLHTLTQIFNYPKYLLVGLLVLVYGVSWGQVTISSGSTVNASSIPAGSSITMESNSVLNMDVTRNFGTLLVRNNNTNTSLSSTIQGSGIATFGSITVNANASGASNSSRSITWIISSESTVVGTSLISSGNRFRSVSVQGTLEITETGIPISATGWTNFTIGSSSTIIYSGGDQTLYNTNYRNLTLSGSGTKTFQTGTTSIAGNLVLAGTASTTTVTNLSIGGNFLIGNSTSLTVGSDHTFSVNGTSSIGGGISGVFNLGGTSSKNFSGDVTINSGATWNESGSGTVTFSGNLINNGTFTANSSIHTLSGLAKTIGGNNIVSIPSLTISGSYTNAGNLTISNSLTGSGSLTQGANSTLSLGGSFSFETFDASTNCPNTVVYSGTNQTILGVNYCNLTLSNSGIKSLLIGSISINGDFTLSGTASTTAVTGLTFGGKVDIGTGTTFSAANFTHNVGGNWTNSGTFTAGNSTINFNSANPGSINTSLGSGSFANISFTGTGTKTITSPLAVSGNITPVSTAVVLSGTNTITLNTGKTMEITSSGSLSTPGTGKLILEPSSIYVNRSTSNPRLEVKQVITGDKGWRMIGSPVNTTYASLTSGLETQGFPGSTNPTLQPNLLWWDETDKGTTLQGWRQPTNLSSSVPAGRGHYLYVFDGASKPAPDSGTYSDVLPKTISVTGTEVNLASGILDFGVTFSARDTNLVAQGDTLIEINQADEGFNLIANPTASTIDFNSSSGWTKTNLDESIYVWDPATSSFLTWNGSVGTLGSGRIAPYQAFWVKANSASPVLRLTGNEAKSLVSTSFYGRKLEEKALLIDLHLSGEGMEAESFISFEKDGATGQDPKDAYQLESLAENWLFLYTYGSLKTQSPLVINNQPGLDGEEKVIPLHIAASKGGQAIAGTYLMDWKIPSEWPSDVPVTLMDHINQKAIDMKAESMHSFSFRGPEVPKSGARKSVSEFSAPRAVIFRSPYESGEINARTAASGKPQRPFTIYIGSFPNDRIEYLPDFPKLFAPVPNPFSEQTKIRFYIPVAEKAEVRIYDILGQEVGSFPAQEYEAGIQELDWIPNAIDLPSGMYVIRLSTTTGQFTQKLIKN